MDISKLDFNWGGAGYPTYDGRLEDDGTMDSQDRTEAALAAFTGQDDGQQDDSAETRDDSGQQRDDAASTGDDDGQQQDDQAASGQLTDEQRAADPVFTELTEFKDQVSQVFDKHGLVAAAEASGRTAHEEADLQLADAGMLYSIMRGEKTPSSLLDSMVNVGNWQKPQIDAVAGDMLAWLTKHGYVKDGQAATPGAGKGAGKDGTLKDPLEERIKNIETAHERTQREQQQRAVQAEQDRVGKIFVDQVEKLCTTAGIAKEDIQFYATQIGAMVNGNKAITDRVAKNNFVDIKRFFDTVHSRELGRLKRFNEAELKKQQGKGRNPKNSAGGSPAAPAGSAKRNVGNRDDRIAAATEMLSGN